jgi:tetratricopeptide (TPR) repeat protein
MWSRRSASRRVTLCVALVVRCAAPLEAATSREMTAQALRDAYNLDFATAYASLEAAARLDPSDPAPVRAAAAVTWMEVLFIQGVATFEAFTGQASKEDVARPVPPPASARRFKTQIERARLLADVRLKASADADAHYQAGATSALAALYAATVEGRTGGAFREGRRAVHEMEVARKLAPARHEAALVLGMSEYSVSTLSLLLRVGAGLLGLSGNKAHALKLLEEAALPSSETESDALLVLTIAYSRERSWTEAAERLGRLQARFPHNRLLRLNAGAMAIEARQFDSAERALADVPAASAAAQPPVVTGERALWLLKRGTARAALGRTQDAAADLQASLAADPRDWVRGRTHYQLAMMASARNEGAAARQHLDLAVDFGRRGGDDAAVRAAEKLRGQTRR